MITKDLDGWVDRLSKRDMPVLANVMGQLNTLTASDLTTANQLVDVILKDPSLTAQVLRIANSVRYNPASQPVTTVSKAVVQIGFSGIRAICLSVGLIDSMLGKSPREKLVETMATSFHAAVQAKDIAANMAPPEREEVFIGALLLHLGEMTLWANTGSQIEELEERLTHPDMNMSKASEDVLGANMKSISSRLGKIWKLGDTLQEALFLPENPSPMVTAVRFGDEISMASKYGWQSDEVKDVLGRLSEHTGRSITDLHHGIIQNAEEAISVAHTYGADRVTHLIPASQNTKTFAVKQATKKEKIIKKKKNKKVEEDALTELEAMVGQRINVNSVFSRVLEGLHNGVGLERVGIAVINNPRTRLNAKYAIGQNTERWRREFSFRLDKEAEDNLFTYAIQVDDPFWFGKNELKTFQHLYSPRVCSVIGRYPAFLAGLHIGGRCIGVFYADRSTSGAELDDAQFEAFCGFVKQTEGCLSLLADKSGATATATPKNNRYRPNSRIV